MGMDVEALWAAAVPELGLDAAPLLDLDDDAPAAPTAVVLPWPSHDPKADAAKAQEPQDLIEAALSGVHADLTAEPVEAVSPAASWPSRSPPCRRSRDRRA